MHGGAQAAGAGRRLPERGTDVVGVQPRVVVERLDALPERAVVATRRRLLPCGLVEGGQHVPGHLRHPLELIGDLPAGPAATLRDLSLGDFGGAEAFELAVGDVGHRAHDVGGHVGDRPAATTRWRRPLLVVEGQDQLAERLELGGKADRGVLA